MDNTIPAIPNISLYPPQLTQLFSGLGNGGISLSAGLGHEVLVGIYFFFLFFYIIVSIALLYHWFEYGMGNKYIILAEISFALVSVFLFWTAYLIISTI